MHSDLLWAKMQRDSSTKISRNGVLSNFTSRRIAARLSISSRGTDYSSKSTACLSVCWGSPAVDHQINGLVQDCTYSSAVAMELPQSFAKQSAYLSYWFSFVQCIYISSRGLVINTQNSLWCLLKLIGHLEWRHWWTNVMRIDESQWNLEERLSNCVLCLLMGKL